MTEKKSAEVQKGKGSEEFVEPSVSELEEALVQTLTPSAHSENSRGTSPKLQEQERNLEEEKAEEQYQVGVWANLPQFVCKCGFDTLDANAMREHLFWNHDLIVDVEVPKE